MDKQEAAREKMQVIAKFTDGLLPPDWGFVVLAFPFSESEGRRLDYVSNADREDVIKAMYEFIAETEKNWGKHT